ncbi:uncharacterized protein LOC124286822 isoform X1 [Haliotis rubra]|uniref:uncharacterized protein LOC124286822 isoform X1 n=2 Tax=Haliotis rubra TaxID=36100 RepID=UPI001EE53605|nr:uncharacterized protein LOC124286822 isoform X1 [Haliotis rubra]
MVTLKIHLRVVGYALLLVGSVLAQNTSTQSATMATDPTTTLAELTTTEKTYGSELERFFADDHNKAMYLVLPCIVLVYGGCGVIYCCSRIRRYFQREKRRKRREMLAVQNGGYDDQDVSPPQNQPFTSAPPPNPASLKPTAPYYNQGQQWKAEDCLALEVSEIDNQLKQAFAMIDDVTKDIKNKRTFENRSKPDIARQAGENDAEIRKKRRYKYKHFTSAN